MARSKAFFGALGFELNQQFTDDKRACLVLGEKSCAMLLSRPSLEGFFPGKGLADTGATAEMLPAVSAPNREAVDTMMANAVAAGGNEYREAADHGWVYYRTFHDLDGHIREALAVDEGLLPEELKETRG